MYHYNLIIKRGSLDEPSTHAMVNRELTTHFGPQVGYIVSAILDNEVVVIVRDESKRNLQSTLGDWFIRDMHTLDWVPGTLLHYRELTEDHPYKTRLGG